MSLNIIYNTGTLKSLIKGSLITIIKDADTKIYRFVGFCPLDESERKIILSNPFTSGKDELFSFTFRNEIDATWILGDALKENREGVTLQIVSQLTFKLNGFKNTLEVFESKKLHFIRNNAELKELDPITPITIIHNGKIKNLCYLSYIENPKTILFCDYVISSKPPVPDFSNEDIYSGNSFRVGIKKDYELLKDDYNVTINPIIIKGVYGNYNSYCQELIKIQIFQLENLICRYLGLTQSSVKDYKDLLFECDASPF